MKQSTSMGNILSRGKLAVAGATKYAGQLPPVATEAAKALLADIGDLETLNAKQEGAKAELKKLTAAVNAKASAVVANRAKIVRLAEATFGPKGAEIKEFRPTTEGKVAPKAKPAAQG